MPFYQEPGAPHDGRFLLFFTQPPALALLAFTSRAA
jgi:hypothetical protein